MKIDLFKGEWLMSDKFEFESKPCPLGCTGEDEIILRGCDRLHGLPGEFTLVRCGICGLMRTDPHPTPETIGFYYPENYGPYHGTKITADRLHRNPRPLLYRVARKVFVFNTDRLPKINPGRMLEIGCASGAFMHRMAAKGWEVEGIEFSPQAAKNALALGYHVHTGSLEAAPEPQQPYDLVVGWMVLEHLYDPVLALQKLARWIRPGGWLVISTPNAAALEFCLFKDLWYALQLPTHLYHYTPKTLRKVLERGGWRMERVFHQRVLSNLVASIGYVLQDRGYSNKLTKHFIEFPEKVGYKNYFLYPLAYILSLLGQTGRMTVWARRIC